MHFEQMSPVIERLRSGHPLTVVGIGSSVMAGHGGCFHRDAQQLLHGRAHGVARWGSQLEPCAQPHGFVGAFMLELNRSYPHPDHVFVNLGMPGTELEHFARRHCFLAAVPPKASGGRRRTAPACHTAAVWPRESSASLGQPLCQSHGPP